MFSFGRKNSRAGPPPNGTTKLRRQPSLPAFQSENIPWPNELVDINAIKAPAVPQTPPRAAPSKLAVQGSPNAVPFHKPFRSSSETVRENPQRQVGGQRQPISSLYMKREESSAEPDGQTMARRVKRSRDNQRKVRLPPTFNLMVCPIILTTLAMLNVSFSRLSAQKEQGKPRYSGCSCKLLTFHPPRRKTNAPT